MSLKRCITYTSRCESPLFNALKRTHTFLPTSRPHYRSSLSLQIRRHNSTFYLPTILQPRFWRTLWPKTRPSLIEESADSSTRKRVKSKNWNPATFFIVIFLLIGSQSIQIIQLRRDFNQFSQQTEAKLALLRDVVNRVKNGEDVDVVKELGTGDPVKEKEWEEVMREIEEEDNIVQQLQEKRRAMRAEAEARARAKK